MKYYPLLFTNDELLARKALAEMERRGEISTNQGAHWAVSLGDEDLADLLYTKLERNDNAGTSLVKGLQFRKERKKGTKNCYQAVLQLEEENRKRIIKEAENTNIELCGGIGDHLEELSRIIPWMEKNNISLKFSSTLNRIRQLEPITGKYQWVRQSSNAVKSKVFLAALGEEIERPGQFIIGDKKEQEQVKKVLICCTATGNNDALSRWSRTINFSEVYQ